METQSPTRLTPRLAYTCPHCSGVLDLTPLLLAPETKATAAPTSHIAVESDAPVRWSPLRRPVSRSGKRPRRSSMMAWRCPARSPISMA